MPDPAAPGPWAVTCTDGAWFDHRRQRSIGWRHYAPGGRPDAPLIIHSHGLGGSCASGADWLAHWASHGLAALALQHPGSDRAALTTGSPLALRRLLRLAVDQAQLAARAADLRFALETLGHEHPARRIGLSGHSYGAVSALRLLGERRGHDDQAADPRIAAAVLFSPSARGGSVALAARFAGIHLPCLHLTGTRDDGIGPGDIAAADRSLPWEHSAGTNQHLLVLDGVRHQDLAGDGLATIADRDRLRASSTQFWQSVLEPAACHGDFSLLRFAGSTERYASR